MKPLLVLLVCGALLGCRKKKAEVPPPAPPPTEEAQPGAPAPSSPPSVSVPAAPIRPAGPHPGEPANPNEVRVAYHQYFARIGNFPNNWPDMIRQKMIPAIPQGKNGQPLDFIQFTLWEAGRPPK